MAESTTINGLYLFKSLIKDGCTWQGDVTSNKWSEALRVPTGLGHQVRLTLEAYTADVDYKIEGDLDDNAMIWIA